LPGSVAPGDFALATARAVLHHVADAQIAVENLVASVRAGGAILLIEPDSLPVKVAEPPEIQVFRDGWLAWSRQQGSTTSSVVGCPRRLPGWDSTNRGESQLGQCCTTAALGGRGTGSSRSSSLRDRLIGEGKLDNQLVDAFPARCAGRTW
jgi:hypothetical protein